MRIPKGRFVVSIIVIASLIGGGTASSEAVEDEQIPSPESSAIGMHSVEMNESSGLKDNVSVLVGTDSSGIKRICKSTSSSPCNSGRDYYFRAVLGPCNTSVSVDCVESVSATSNGATTNGVFLRTFPLQGVTDYVDDVNDKIPNGTAPGMWDFPSIPHAFGSQYQVTVSISGAKVNGDTLRPKRTFFANITPVSVSPVACTVAGNGHCMDTFYEDSATGRVEFAGVAADQDAGVRCQNWGENSQCALKHAFPTGVSFTLKVRLRTVPDGWLHGRLTDPTASIVTEKEVTTVTISAAPTKISVAAAAVDWSVLPDPLRAWFDQECSTRCGTRVPESRGLPGPQRNAVSGPTAFSETAFTQLALWRETMKDTAYAIPSVWNVRALSYDEMQKAPDCIKNGTGITGIVSTNSTLYSEGPPAFNSTQSTLDYKVAALHYERDGKTPFLGSYSLLLREDIAQCLYNAMVFSTDSNVSVTAENGVASSATTSFSQSNGWFKFVASGYTHSAPTIQAKLIPTWASVKKGKTLSVKTIAKFYGIQIPKKATVSAVTKSSKKICVMRGKLSVVGKSKGTCVVKISVKPAKTKKVPKPKTVTKTVKVIVK